MNANEIPKKKRNILRDPNATAEEVKEEMEKTKKENSELKEEIGELKKKLQIEKQTVRNEKQKLVFQKNDLLKKIGGFVNENDSQLYFSQKKILQEKFDPLVQSLLQKLEQSTKKFENLSEVFGNFLKILKFRKIRNINQKY